MRGEFRAGVRVGRMEYGVKGETGERERNEEKD